MKRLGCLFLILMISAICFEAAAKQRAKNKTSKPRKRGQFVIAPIPVSSPALGSSLVHFFDESLGSRRQYQTYKLSFNRYRPLNEKSVLAWCGVLCSANQRVPFLRSVFVWHQQRYSRFTRAANFRTGGCLLEKKNHINYRVDWAVGRAGHTLTIGIGEAF